ncbi:UNVERIFIED_CONTAM: hypothetical protein K2H54_008400 [Gekko kuhli]
MSAPFHDSSPKEEGSQSYHRGSFPFGSGAGKACISNNTLFCSLLRTPYPTGTRRVAERALSQGIRGSPEAWNTSCPGTAAKGQAGRAQSDNRGGLPETLLSPEIGCRMRRQPGKR